VEPIISYHCLTFAVRSWFASMPCPSFPHY
jgi:hypothetical protein